MNESIRACLGRTSGEVMDEGPATPGRATGPVRRFKEWTGATRMVRPNKWSVHMNVKTSRFGTVEIDADRIITFKSGLLGFANQTRFALLQPNPEGVFYWLQAVDAPDLAFVVTDPSLFVTGYEVPIRDDQAAALGLKSLEEAQVLVIVNRYGESLTGNLQGPLVINVDSRVGEQLVLADQRWSTRHRLVDVGAAAHAASA